MADEDEEGRADVLVNGPCRATARSVRGLEFLGFTRAYYRGGETTKASSSP